MPRIRTLAAAAALALAASSPLHAADAAAGRPITLIVPFAAGGGVDGMGRLLAERLRSEMPQGVVVENKPGASGMLGAQAVVRAAPDGATLLLGSAGETAINPLVFKGKMQYQPEKDLAPIALIARVPNVLVANPKLPVANVEELVAYGRAHPGKLTYATSGVGNPQHLNGELLQSLAGIKMVHVPYKGASAQLVDVAAGSVDLTFVSLAGALPFIKGGKVKPLAVTSPQRASFAPDIPAVAEYAPLKDYALENWFGVFVPAATPAELRQKLADAIGRSLKDEKFVASIRELGGEVQPMSQDEFRAFIKAQTAVFAKVVADGHITAEN
ncbi:Bug family tripartite tricarboxylate transporter substrate binding protein [Achromobacter deleyi]|uniref:Bug family tripartite tricarboxylate transporter substrate binding protein n=1 Tax=Achromobacter deleyi TaxID=1353891 RepID=UPI0014910C7E|nr:tripartite tricarboxylate transporter substrate binding protein [Achromobacter deleyi]QVQ26498.1 tripartite tricarboxylate transporter substrate binding protein [Achromobacter deleyi]UIP22070.1 tripartite tricarboxylate transporter substrate binding protein [Achromobacter deleyi]